MKPFCDILKSKRAEQNLTRKDLSRLAGVSTAALGFYETDKNDPTCPVLIQLARALHTSIDDLVGYSVDPLPEYERYKRYLESDAIGARVSRNSDDSICVTVDGDTGTFPDKDTLVETMHIAEGTLPHFVDELKARQFKRTISDFCSRFHSVMKWTRWMLKTVGADIPEVAYTNDLTKIVLHKLRDHDFDHIKATMKLTDELLEIDTPSTPPPLPDDTPLTPPPSPDDTPQ